MTPKTDKETMAELLHDWYPQATDKLKPESYNQKAQIEYKDLTNEQKPIDRFIAGKVVTMIHEVEDDARRDERAKILKAFQEGELVIRFTADGVVFDEVKK